MSKQVGFRGHPEIRQAADRYLKERKHNAMLRLFNATEGKALDCERFIQWPALASSFAADVAYIAERMEALGVKR